MADSIESYKLVCSGGLNSNENHLDLSDNKSGAATRLVNFEPSLYGGYRRLEGYNHFGDIDATVGGSATEGKVLGLAIYDNSHIGNPYVIAARKVAGSNTYKFYKFIALSGWQEITSAPARSMTIGSRYVDKLRHVQFDWGSGSTICFVDGVNPAVIFDGANWYELLQANTGGTSSPGGDQLVDAPSIVGEYQKHLWVGGDKVSRATLRHSAANDPYTWTNGAGGGLVNPAFNVVQIKPFRDNLFVFGSNGIKKIVTTRTNASPPATVFTEENVTNNVGCIARDSVVEIAGDLLFLAPDGFRPVSSTSKIGDVELETVSKPIQVSLVNLIKNNDMDTLNSVVIRGKSQVRFFVGDDTTDQIDSTGIIGGLYDQAGSIAWSFGELTGIRASVTESGYMGTEELVLHGDYDGKVYEQEKGNNFAGNNIIAVYSTPYLDFGDTEVRKTIRKVNTFVRAEGPTEFYLNVDYDWGDYSASRPSEYVQSSDGGPVVYNGLNLDYGDANVLYGGNSKPILTSDIQGSGFSTRATFVTIGQSEPYSIQGIVFEFSVSGRRQTMAGYTRQSVSQIQNGADITAPPLNAEFNQLLAAFNAASGHGHTGATGDAPPIPLATSLSGYLPAVHGGTGGRNNNSASSNPTVTDDSGSGYAVGSVWLNTANDRIFICVNNTANAALWNEVVASDGLKFHPETTNTVDIGTSSNRYKNMYLSGTATIPTVTSTTINSGTITSTGMGTFPTVNVDGGTVDGTVIGGNSPSAITGTQITANSGFVGGVTGDLVGNVTSTGTSGFNNITASGTIQGAVTGDISGNVTSTGTSAFNNVTIAGTLNMDGSTTATIQNLTDPTNPKDAATKSYVDTGLANLVDSSPAALDTLNELAAAIGDDSNFSTTMTNALAGKVADTGDTMTGDLIMSGGVTVTGLPLPTANSEASSKQYTDQQDALQVTKSGDTMSGSLAMGGNKITGLGTPSANTDASTKGYVDGILGSATAASASAAAAATSEANAATSEANAAQSAVSAATALTASQHFLDTYFVSASAPSGSNLSTGDLWFDTANNLMKVYGASGFQNAGSSVNGTAERKDYTASANQTSFAATYDPNFCDVYLNGVKLAPSDFTATNGSSVVLASGAAAGDAVSIVSYGTFLLADHYNKSTVDALIDDVETLALAGL